MKLIARTLMLLALALAVAGVTYLWARSSSAEALISSARGNVGVQRGGAPPAEFRARSEVSGEDGGNIGRGESHGPSLFGAIQMLRPLAEISVLVAITALATGLTRKWRGAGRATTGTFDQNNFGINRRD